MPPISSVGRLPGRFLALIAVWVAFTCVSSASGGHYVQRTLDCLTPALVAQAAAALLFSITNSLRNFKKDGFGPCLTEQQHAARHAWVLALGLLHLLASILTLASFGLSSVAETYIIRTLEPIFSCVLLYIVHGHKRSPTEVLLLAVVAIATASVVLSGAQPSRSLLLSSDPAGQQAGALLAPHAAAQAGGYLPVALALVATLAISCRSVASKSVTAVTGSPEYDTFLQASVPGLVVAAVLQGALWVLFGVKPLHSSVSEWSPSLPAALVLCGVSQCAYNAASFRVLQQCSPVMHGVLNVLKRVFITVGGALLLGSPLSAAQLLGVVVANAAAAAYGIRQAAAHGAHSSTCGAATPAADHHPSSDAHSESKGKTRFSWYGGAASPAVQSLSRLVGVVGSTLVISALFLAYVLAALHAKEAGQHDWPQQQHHQPQLTTSQHQPVLNIRLPTDWQASPAAAAAAAAAALSPHAAGWSDGLEAGYAAMSASSPINSTTPALSRSVERFLVRDFGRIQCLTTLHEVSKASLAPFLHDRTRGGIALFDVALHKNLGDAVLWAAAARLVPSFHDSVKYVCAQSQFPGRGAEARRHFPKCNVKAMLKAIGPQGVVLLAPGGNWGDLWWFVHSQRLTYLREMAAAARGSGSQFQVVQLPQSLTFSNASRASEDQAVINSLPPGMLALFTRQQTSLTYAQAHYPNATVLPAPDLAFSLGPLMGGQPQYDVLFLMRKDKEAAGSESPLIKLKPGAAAPPVHQRPAAAGGGGGGSGGARDSGDVGAGDDADAAVTGALAQLREQRLTYTIREWEFAHENYTKEVSRVALVQIAESRLQGAIDVISLGKVVVTNRLHAAIMANLVGRPLVWIDTQQKKLSGVRSLAFAHSSSCSERNLHSVQAGSFAEAAGIATQWLQSPDFIWSAQQLKLPQLRRH